MFRRTWHTMEIPEQGRVCFILATSGSSGEYWKNRPKTREPINLLHLVNIYWAPSSVPGRCWVLGTCREMRADPCCGGMRSEEKTDVLQGTMSSASATGCLRRDGGEQVKNLEPKHSSEEEAVVGVVTRAGDTVDRRIGRYRVSSPQWHRAGGSPDSACPQGSSWPYSRPIQLSGRVALTLGAISSCSPRTSRWATSAL